MSGTSIYQWVVTACVAALVAVLSFVNVLFNRKQTRNSTRQVESTLSILEREENRSHNESTAFMQLDASHRAAILYDAASY